MYQHVVPRLSQPAFVLIGQCPWWPVVQSNDSCQREQLACFLVLQKISLILCFVGSASLDRSCSPVTNTWWRGRALHRASTARLECPLPQLLGGPEGMVPFSWLDSENRGQIFFNSSSATVLCWCLGGAHYVLDEWMDGSIRKHPLSASLGEGLGRVIRGKEWIKRTKPQLSENFQLMADDPISVTNRKDTQILAFFVCKPVDLIFKSKVIST